MERPRVLVVEDEALLGLVLGEVLEDLGYEVCAIVATQVDAVEAAQRCRPDLMIVDVRLRTGSGIAAMAQICRSGFIPHVFTTGDIAEVIALRPDAIAIQKPFAEAELSRAIQRSLAAARRPDA